ncbi:hypothetical protein D3C80_1940230 [compost metagenome]
MTNGLRFDVAPLALDITANTSASITNVLNTVPSAFSLTDRPKPPPSPLIWALVYQPASTLPFRSETALAAVSTAAVVWLRLACNLVMASALALSPAACAC